MPSLLPMSSNYKKSNELSFTNVIGIDSHTGNDDNNSTDVQDFLSTLSNLRLNNNNRVMIAHLNINSLRNKFDMLSEIVASKLDILLVSETTLDNSFSTAAFFMPGFSKPVRLDRSSHGGGLILYPKNITFKLFINSGS